HPYDLHSFPTRRSSDLTFAGMSDADFQSTVDAISKVIDGVGVLVIVIGLVLATAGFAAHLRRSDERPTAYRVFRQQVGKAILLGDRKSTRLNSSHLGTS